MKHVGDCCRQIIWKIYNEAFDDKKKKMIADKSNIIKLQIILRIINHFVVLITIKGNKIRWKKNLTKFNDNTSSNKFELCDDHF